MTIHLQTFDEFIAEVKAEIVPVFKPAFRSVAWREIGNRAVDHSYLVKGLLVNAEKSVLAGESQAGKSFLATDLALAVARATSFQGHKVPVPRGVIYICAESAGGVVNLRIPAYKKYFDLDDPDLPIQFVVQSPDFFNSQDDTTKLLKDIEHYASGFRVPLGLIVIDTFSASTPGADENKSADVSRILSRFDDLREYTGAHVMVVHHMNAEGSKLRGHTSMVGNFDTIMVVHQTEERDKPSEEGKVGRPIRTMTLQKRKDGLQGALRKFVLRVVDLGVDEDGEPITSCVCDVPEGVEGADLTTKWKEVGMYQLPNRVGFGKGMRALFQAMRTDGRPPPKDLPTNSDTAILVSEWMKAFMDLAADSSEDQKTTYNRIKKQREALEELLLRDNVIGKKRDWVWRTKRRIQGFDMPLRAPGGKQEEAPPTKAEPAVLSTDPFFKDDGLPFF